MPRKPERARHRGRGVRPQGLPPVASESATPLKYRVEALGAGGDGLGYALGYALSAEAPTSPVFIPFTAPGDEVLARPVGRDRAALVEILTAAPDRVTPPCSLFGTCGGCALQHLSPAWLLDWKVSAVLSGLRRAGQDALPEADAFQTPPASRRRADLAVRRSADGIALGLHRRGGDVVDMTECHLLRPEIVAVLPALRALLGGLDLLRREADLVVNLLDSGLDFLVASDGAPSTADRVKLADFCRRHGILRFAWRVRGRQDAPETLARLAPSVIGFAGIPVDVPPGAFLQASAEGEAAIRDAVLAALPPAPGRKARIVELYAGCGTLTFPLAAHARVEAFEGHPGALAALIRASAGQRVDGFLRDLERQPVEAKELGAALAVVLDPPHTGAGLQMTQILDGKPPVVVYVSCNPRVLFRDAALLFKAGYRLDAVSVVDQFLWSAETEIVCRFSRKPTRS